MKKNIHVIIAYGYHIIFVILGFMLMGYYHDSMLGIALAADIAYILYWIIVSWRKYMPWLVYVHFAIGTAVEFALNCSGLIAENEGMFSGLAQFFYLCLLALHLLIIGIINFILWLIHRKK